MANSAHADIFSVFWDGVKWSAAEVDIITGRLSQARGSTLPYWVAALIQRPTDPEQDHLSLLWSPYKSSTFPLFSSAAHKLIKLAFPCCFWQKEWERHPQRCIVGGQCIQTHACFSVSTGSAAKLLFLPKWYICSFWFQLNKCRWGQTCIWDDCFSHEPSLWFLGLVGVCLCLSCTFQSVSVLN